MFACSLLTVDPGGGNLLGLCVSLSEVSVTGKAEAKEQRRGVTLQAILPQGDPAPIQYSLHCTHTGSLRTLTSDSFNNNELTFI